MTAAPMAGPSRIDPVAPKPGRGGRRAKLLVAFAVKAALTATLIWLLDQRVDFAAAFARMASLPAIYPAALLVLALTQLLLAGERLAAVARLRDVALPRGRSLVISFGGAFFSQALVTFLSGDALRGWWLARQGAAPLTAVEIVLLDRILGVVALVALAALGAVPLLTALPSAGMRAGAALVIGAAVGAVIAFFALGALGAAWPRLARHARWGRLAWVVDLALIGRHVWQRPRDAAVAIAHSLIIHLLSVAIVYALFIGVGAEVSLWQCLVVVPAIMLIVMLPVAIAGWGLREGAMVAAFGAFGIGAEPALAVSVAFGLLLLAATLPGAVSWWSLRRRAGNGAAE